MPIFLFSDTNTLDIYTSVAAIESDVEIYDVQDSRLEVYDRYGRWLKLEVVPDRLRGHVKLSYFEPETYRPEDLRNRLLKELNYYKKIKHINDGEDYELYSFEEVIQKILVLYKKYIK